MQDHEAVGAAEGWVAGALGVRHEAENIARFVADAGDVFAGAVRICGIGHGASGVAVAHEDLVVGVEFGERGVVGEVAALAVRDGDVEDLAFGGGTREARVRGFHAEVLVFADEVEALVAHERAGEESALAEDLEAVADAEDRATGGGEIFHRLHDGRKPRDRAAAQVVAVGKPTGDDDGIEAGERGVLVPHEVGGGAGERVQGEDAILVAVRTGEAEDGEFHGRAME